MTDLTGTTIAVLTTNMGVEKPELEQPLSALTAAGATVHHVALAVEPVQSMVNDTDKDATFDPDLALSDVSVDDYDALVLPGGTVNSDTLRTETAAVDLVRAFAAEGKTVAAICHAPWVLVEADVLGGKTLTSYPSLRTDVRNAGGSWVDTEVKHCTANGWSLITSRNPGDLDAFNATIVEALGG